MRREGGNTSNGLTNPDTGKANQAVLSRTTADIRSSSVWDLGTLQRADHVNFQTNQVLGGGTTSDYHDITNLWSFTDSVELDEGQARIQIRR